MKVKFRKNPDMPYIGRQIERDIRNFLTVRLVTGLREFHRAISENTPVYTGRTLVNYRWSLGAAIDVRRAAVRTPALPGTTSDLGLGNEPRRAANQAIIDAEFEEVVRSIQKSRNPFVKVFLTNNVPNFDQIEYGTYSDEARTPPGGMVRRGEVQLRMIIKGIRKVA